MKVTRALSLLLALVAMVTAADKDGFNLFKGECRLSGCLSLQNKYTRYQKIVIYPTLVHFADIQFMVIQ
jgi:hypothetical protein